MAEDGIFIFARNTVRQPDEDGGLQIFREASFQSFDGDDAGLEPVESTKLAPDDGGGFGDYMPGDEFWF